MYLLSALFFVNIEILNVLASSVSSSCPYNLHVFNDGPATQDVPVLISAYMECANEKDLYTYVFEDENARNIEIQGHQAAAATFIFSDSPGVKTVHVVVYLMQSERTKVASGDTTIEIHEYIPGKLKFSGAVTDQDFQSYIASGRKTNISVDIKYPPRIFQEAEFSYSWTIGESRFTTNHPYKVYIFKDPGPQWIRAAVVARIPSYDETNVTRYKWGYFDKEVIVKNPFTNLNITGNTYLQHGQLLRLEISCDGSGPINYCWKILPPIKNSTKLSCTDPVTVVQCSFPIIYYFQDSGEFLLAISVDNLVSYKQRNIEIHIYDVSLRPQLSTIIIPVVCTVLVLLIVAGAVVAHVRRNKNYDTETADFDFMVADEFGAVFVETSWEHMRRSFLRLLSVPYIYFITEASPANYGTALRNKNEHG